MHLQEDYARRHGLDERVVVYARRVVALMWDYRGGAYSLSSHWQEPAGQLGVFDVTFSKFVPDGQTTGTVLAEYDRCETCGWEEYETVLGGMVAEAKRMRLRAVADEDKPGAAWRIFLDTHKSCLADRMKPTFFKSAPEKAQARLRPHADLCAAWEHQFRPLAAGTSAWLARLIND